MLNGTPILLSYCTAPTRNPYSVLKQMESCLCQCHLFQHYMSNCYSFSLAKMLSIPLHEGIIAYRSNAQGIAFGFFASWDARRRYADPMRLSLVIKHGKSGKIRQFIDFSSSKPPFWCVKSHQTNPASFIRVNLLLSLNTFYIRKKKKNIELNPSNSDRIRSFQSMCTYDSASPKPGWSLHALEPRSKRAETERGARGGHFAPPLMFLQGFGPNA